MLVHYAYYGISATSTITLYPNQGEGSGKGLSRRVAGVGSSGAGSLHS